MTDTAPFAYSAPHLAAAWSVSTRLVYDLYARGELGHFRIGGLIRIRQSDREAYEARQWHAPGSPPRAHAVTVPGPSKVPGRGAFQRGRQTAGAKRDARLAAKSEAVR